MDIRYDMELSDELRNRLMERGAALVGYGGLGEIPEDARHGMPVGVSVAVLLPKDVIRGITEWPTKEYLECYRELNSRLDGLVTYGAEIIEAHGYKALARTREAVGGHDDMLRTELPHKTAATRAGLGWIGKCALLITPEYGPMVRLSAILTDAPLPLAEPVNESKCGNCTVCRDACPGNAVSGKLWTPGLPREELVDAEACRRTAIERTTRYIGVAETICGRCIALCPYTKRYLDGEEV